MHQSSSSMMDSEVTGRWCPSPFPAQWLSSLEWWQKWTRSRSLQLSCITLGEIYLCPVTVELPEFEMGSTLVHEILYPLFPSGSPCRIWLDSCWCLALTQWTDEQTVFTHFRSANLRGFHQWPFMRSLYHLVSSCIILYHLVSSCIPFCSSSLSERVQVRLAVTFESGTSNHCILYNIYYNIYIYNIYNIIYNI